MGDKGGTEIKVIHPGGPIFSLGVKAIRDRENQRTEWLLRKAFRSAESCKKKDYKV